MATEVRRPRTAPGTVLRGIAWETYQVLRDNPRNDLIRMSYLDGILILMSPEFLHDFPIRRLMLVVDSVTEALGIPTQGTASTTLRRQGPAPRKGGAKETDYGFYFGDNEARMRIREQIDLEIDPPPDLAIEVEPKADSRKAMKIYARLRVPEVWRYQVKTRLLRFDRLVGDSYEPIERSLALPKLTPARVLHALGQVNRLGETAWKPWLREWVRGLPLP